MPNCLKNLTAGSNYAITYVGANLAITAKPITVTADAQTKVYGETDQARQIMHRYIYRLAIGAFAGAFGVPSGWAGGRPGRDRVLPAVATRPTTAGSNSRSKPQEDDMPAVQGGYPPLDFSVGSRNIVLRECLIARSQERWPA